MKTLSEFLNVDQATRCQQLHDYKHSADSLEKSSLGNDISDIGIGINLSLDEAVILTKKARERSRKIAEESPTLQDHLEASPNDPKKWNEQFAKSKCYFLAFDVIAKFFGVPGIDGIRIYKGLNQENDKEVLILVAATNYKGQSYDIFKYEYTFVDETVSVPMQDAPIIALNPCPPPSPCPHSNKLNSTPTPS